MATASLELSPAARALWPKREGGIERGDGGAPARTRSVSRGGRTASESTSQAEAEHGGRRR